MGVGAVGVSGLAEDCAGVVLDGLLAAIVFSCSFRVLISHSKTGGKGISC